MIQFKPEDLIQLGKAKAAGGDYGEALTLIKNIDTPLCSRLRAAWSYEHGKQLVSEGKYEVARGLFSTASRRHERSEVRSLAAERNALINRILQRQQTPVTKQMKPLEDINIAWARALPPTAFAPTISYVGCPAAYRSGFDPKRGDPLSRLIRMLKENASTPTKIEGRIRAVELVGDLLAVYAYERTPLLRDVDVLVPVPPELNRWERRGFSIPVTLAKRISVVCAVPALFDVVETAGLQIDLRTVPKSQRRYAVSGAFRTTDKASILEGLNVVIVDDVMTSGATVMELARVFKKLGTRNISAIAVAHSEWGG